MTAGPDAFLSLDGYLAVHRRQKRPVSGTLVGHNGRRLHVTGSVTGRIFRLRIKLPSGVISGSGTAKHTITTCNNAPARET